MLLKLHILHSLYPLKDKSIIVSWLLKASSLSPPKSPKFYRFFYKKVRLGSFLGVGKMVNSLINFVNKGVRIILEDWKIIINLHNRYF